LAFLDSVKKYLLFREPTEPELLFESGIEDRLLEAERLLADSGTDHSAPGQGSRRSRERKVRRVGSHNAKEGRDGVNNQAEGNKQSQDGDAVAENVQGQARQTQQKKDQRQFEEMLAKMEADRTLTGILDAEIKLFEDLEYNQKILEKIFRKPTNVDPVFRPLLINHKPPVKALIVFIDGIVQGSVIISAILRSLMLQASLRKDDAPPEKEPRGNGRKPVKAPPGFFDRVMQALVAGHQVSTVKTFKEAVNEALNGNTVLIIDGLDKALSIETKGFANRGVGEPKIENVIRGPHEALVEQIRINTSLIRKILRHPSLVTEFVKVGEASNAQYAIMYRDDITNPALVKEVKRRLSSLKVDFPHESGILEQLIEDSPYALAPQVLATERPDRVAAGIMEGRVAILADNSPFALVVPATLFTMMQSGEDAYVRWPYGSFTRLVRWFGLTMALFLPGFYVAVATYHQEFIPTDLLLAITGARERVPFPTIVEVLLMEVAFELIREGGIRIPGTIGTTLGIVGALILGQAAVAANIVSPILIVIIAVTALGAFAIPNYAFSLNIRLLRFAYTLAAAVFGIFGMIFVLFLHVGLLSNLKSFGVPFLAPLVPATKAAPDLFLRGHAWQQEVRPDYVDPLRTKRQPRVSRQWVKEEGDESRA